MARRYLIFGSDDKVHWELLNTIEASGAPQALSKAREQEAHRHYACTPERNWNAATPEVVERKPIVRWAPVTSGQLTVDDMIAQGKEAIAQGKETAEKSDVLIQDAEELIDHLKDLEATQEDKEEE